MLKIYSKNIEIPLDRFRNSLEMKTKDKVYAFFNMILENPFIATWLILPGIKKHNMSLIAKNIAIPPIQPIIVGLIIVAPILCYSFINFIHRKAGSRSSAEAFLNRQDGVDDFDLLREITQGNHQKTALILCERSDRKGITNITRKNTSIHSFNFAFIKFAELAKDHNLIFHEVGSINEVKNVLNSQKSNSIQTLVIHGHGTDSTISLDGTKNEKINIQSIDDSMNVYSNSFKQIIIKVLNFSFKIFNKNIYTYLGFSLNKLNFHDFSCLKENSNIILFSCLTGNDKDENSIAKKISTITNNRKVFAPIKLCTRFNFIQKQPNFIYGKSKDNITAMYQNGQTISS